MSDAKSPIAQAKKRADRAWTNRSQWDAIYSECYDYAIPNRRPGGKGKSKRLASKIYDMTAPISVMYGANTLVRQIMPPGQEPFYMQAGHLLRNRLAKEELKEVNRQFALKSKEVHPFFKAGDFDQALHTTAIDLFVGTGGLIPMRGPSIEEPIIFVNVPLDELAVAVDGYGRVYFAVWMRDAGFEEIQETWKQGKFSKKFKDKAAKDPDAQTKLYQTFTRLPNGYWQFAAFTEYCDEFIVTSFSRAKPIATPRFYRGPGEAYGRGPLMMALPTIKTANKAQEIALKSAAIQMLGIWAYRAGSTFNPNAVKAAPGEMWAMESTGGILGPDITRLDTPNARFDIAKMVIGDQQKQIREALLDTRIMDDGSTPASASEIAARVQQSARAHIGAYGGMIKEIMPVCTARTIEILNELGIVQMPVPINDLLYSIEVVSPMTMAVKADQLQAAVQYVELTNALFEMPNTGKAVSMDRLQEHARMAMMIDPDLVPTAEELQAQQAQEQEKMAAQVASEAAVRAAPQLVQAANENVEAA